MKKRIAFFLFPKIHLLDLAGPAQVFYEANQIGKLNLEIHYVSSSENIETEQKIQFAGLQHMQNTLLQKGDLICIPGIDFNGFRAGEMDGEIGKAKDWIWAQKKKGVHLASICSGALILAKLGLLDHVKCTTHWKCMEYFKSHFPKAKVQENRLYCFDKNTFTSAGMTTGIDMCLALVEKWTTPLLAAQVAQEMVINVRRSETREQKNIFLDFKNHFNADVYKAQELLANRMDARFTIGALAKEMNLSPRHLARIFKERTGQTIQAYRNELRLKHGERLLLNSEMSVKEIAVACGFENARQFVRLWKTKRAIPPGRYRKRVQNSVVE